MASRSFAPSFPLSEFIVSILLKDTEAFCLPSLVGFLAELWFNTTFTWLFQPTFTWLVIIDMDISDFDQLPHETISINFPTKFFNKF
ncbi:hypothetical protein CEXT_641361 [Caerostris extrusa]|uniref:Uncharacterized protein n=1 Tax=Caerostris extrusa TaxID=172846 RepID=A0AAV4QUL1_CAEEX|nr:hypothetical protein CEXT_641361 [Caerostris extrusa]